MQKKQVVLLTAHSVVFEPKPNKRMDWFFFAYSSLVAIFIVGIIAVSQSLKQPFYKLFWRVTVPVSLPAILNISIYLFINAMTTVSAVVFLYSTDTALASVAVLNMNDAGDIAPAAAMGMMIFYTNAGARIIHALATCRILARSNAWRTSG